MTDEEWEQLILEIQANIEYSQKILKTIRVNNVL